MTFSSLFNFSTKRIMTFIPPVQQSIQNAFHLHTDVLVKTTHLSRTKMIDRSTPFPALFTPVLQQRKISTSTIARESPKSKPKSEPNPLAQYIKYKTLALEGSRYAQFWLGEVSQLNNPIPYRSSVAPKKPMPESDFFLANNIRQSALLRKFGSILNNLQKYFPKDYKTNDIRRLERELKDGHCAGFSFYYIFLALSHDLYTFQDKSHQYLIINKKIINIQLYKIGKKLNHLSLNFEELNKLSKKNQDFVLAFKESLAYIAHIRYLQHTFWESYIWKNQWCKLSHKQKNMFGQESNAYQNVQIPIAQYLLGPEYIEKLRLTFDIENNNIETLIPAMRAYLTPSNAAYVVLPIRLNENPHAVVITYREGMYNYFDSNLSSLEENYDPRYSAIRCKDLKKVIGSIKAKFFSSFEIKNEEIKGQAIICFIDHVNHPNLYLTPNLEKRRSEVRPHFLKLNRLIHKNGHKEFLSLVSEIEAGSGKIKADLFKRIILYNPHFFRYFPYEIFPLEEIHMGELEVKDDYMLRILIEKTNHLSSTNTKMINRIVEIYQEDKTSNLPTY